MSQGPVTQDGWDLELDLSQDSMLAVLVARVAAIWASRDSQEAGLWGGRTQKAQGEPCRPLPVLLLGGLHCTGTDTDGLLAGVWGPGQPPRGKGLSLGKHTL